MGVDARTALDADRLRVQVREILDVVVRRQDEHALAGDEVRIAQIDHRGALVRNREPRDDHVDLQAREGRYGGARIYRDPLDHRVLVLPRAEDGLRELAPKVRLESRVPAARIATRDRSGVVEYADPDLSFGLKRVHVRRELKAWARGCR